MADGTFLASSREFLVLSRNYFFFLLFVVIFIGWGLPYIYVLFESFYWRIMLGRSPVGRRLSADAIRDFRRFLAAHELDRGITRPAAVLFAIPARLASLRELGRMLRRLKKTEARVLYRQTLENLAEGWRAGLQTSVVIEYLQVLERIDTPVEVDRILGKVLTANVTYLLGDLEKGHRLARKVMESAREHDEPGKPYYQWLASYALWNSRLFMGEFDVAANELGDLWRSQYACYSEAVKNRLHEFYQANPATLDPIASVPRHLILASALKGESIITGRTQAKVLDKADERDQAESWVEQWYKLGQSLCEPAPIALDFTHAYMALYCTVVEPLYPPPELLGKILDTAPIVSLYVKHGMMGLYHFERCEYDKAVHELRVADAKSGISGNSFLECIFLPAQAAAAAMLGKSLHPEIRALMSRVRKRAAISPNNFYDLLIYAAEAVIAEANEEKGRRDHLLGRVQRLSGGDLSRGFVKIFHLNKLTVSKWGKP
ncbi:MAG TPA: hypothetical protein VF179_08940 [Thermoanaerobaculia bacterium]|nr:hypothetical protein [Thermoanaerobaculia bacterium]